MTYSLIPKYNFLMSLLINITIFVLIILPNAVLAEQMILKFKKASQNQKKSLSHFHNVKRLHYSSPIYLVESDRILTAKDLIDVEYIEPNYRYYPLLTPVDPLFKKQWGAHNIKRTIFGDKRGADLNMLKAWELTLGSNEIIIAVIDSGIDITHPDLKNNLWINHSELDGITGVDDDNNGFVDDVYGYDFLYNKPLIDDQMGHGTHCAGIIGAEHNNIGIAGVMSKVQLMGLKFFDGDGGSVSDAIRAIYYAVDNGAKIISNSWGGFSYSKALFDAIKYANSKGVVFVAAAGNSYANNDTDPLYPASYNIDNIISVGSISSKGKKSSFSNYGKKTVHVFAPGSNILSTVQNGEYIKMSGTSMAAPHIAGITGLIFSMNSNLSPLSIKELLIKSSKQVDALKKYSISGGYVDAYQALLFL